MPHHTEPSAPGQLQTVQALSCQSVNVRWTPPTNNGGIPLIGYTVWYGKDSKLTMAVNSSTESVNITGIPPNTTIGTTVAARNSIGLGEKSKMMNVTTHSRSSETLVSVTAVTANTMLINRREEESYVQCILRGRNASVRHESVQQLSKEISSLQPDTNYTLSCVAYDNNGLDLCIEDIIEILTSEITFLTS